MKIDVISNESETTIGVNGITFIRYKRRMDGSAIRSLPFVENLEIAPSVIINDFANSGDPEQNSFVQKLQLWLDGLERPVFVWNQIVGSDTRYSYVCKSNGIGVVLADIYLMGNIHKETGRWYEFVYGDNHRRAETYEEAKTAAEIFADTWILQVVGRVSMRTEDLPDYLIKEIANVDTSHLVENEIEDDPYPYGYHIRKIEKGVVGEASKIREETEEFLDAIEQNASVMALVELSDLIGAIDSYLNKYHPSIKISDLATMSDITKRAFLGGHRS